MKRIALFAMCTLTILVLLFGYHTSTSSKAARGQSSFIATTRGGPASTSPNLSRGSAAAASPSVNMTAASTITWPTTATGPVSNGSSAASAATKAATGAATRTITGHVLDTRWGPVQVQLTVVGNRKIISVAVVQYPDGNERDQQINARALPMLVPETITAQSANIDMVSGATVTSDGYLGSLQSALDQM